MTDITIRTTLQPGDLGRLIALHGIAYKDDPAHFGLRFEAHVARTVADFMIDNDGKGRIWLAEKDGELVGCTAMADRGGKGQLRWVLLMPEARGLGLGGKLVREAIDYAAAQGWSEVFLETTEGLDASMAIYLKLGFQTESEETQKPWGLPLKVIRMRKKLA